MKTSQLVPDLEGVPRLVLAALYLNGLERGAAPSARFWPEVARALRASPPSSPDTAPGVLRRAGLPVEALLLETPGLLESAARLVRRGAVLTLFDDAYPTRWRRRLREAAPPALWQRGEVPEASWLAVVGGRRVSAEVRSWAAAVGAEAGRLGFGVVSGGAAGCDRAALAAAGSARLAILPYGLRRAALTGVALSRCAPDEEFTVATAMERNVLIYAAAEAAVVVQARFKQGGTWHGAVTALRRRLCPLLVRDLPEDPAHRALVALGATPLRAPEELASALAAASASAVPQGALPGVA
jgi:predicted Rossmann fold nucleotide-binding protein DprA/Smf involved in DNA uptake